MPCQPRKLYDEIDRLFVSLPLNLCFSGVPSFNRARLELFNSARIPLYGKSFTLTVDSAKPEFEKAALAELGLLYRVARRYAMNATDAEDLVSQTLLSAAKAWDQFDGKHIRSWLITILKNEHLKMIRYRSSRPKTIGLEDGFEHSGECPDEQINQRAFVDDILRELDSLPEDFRMAVALCDVEQMSYEDAAAALAVPVGTIRSRLFRGRRALREKLKAWPSDTSPNQDQPGRLTSGAKK